MDKIESHSRVAGDSHKIAPSEHAFNEAYRDLRDGLKGLAHLGSGAGHLVIGAVLKEQEIHKKINDLEAAAVQATARGISWGAHAVGNAAVHGAQKLYQSGKNLGNEIVRENPELVNGAKSIGHAAGALAQGAVRVGSELEKRDVAFHKTRPVDASIASVVLMDHVVGAALGGLHSEQQRKTEKQEPHHSTVNDHKISERTKPVSGDSGKNNLKPLEIVPEKCDSYWTLAKKTLADNATNAQIAKAADAMQKANKNKAVRSGEPLILAG